MLDAGTMPIDLVKMPSEHQKTLSVKQKMLVDDPQIPSVVQKVLSAPRITPDVSLKSLVAADKSKFSPNQSQITLSADRQGIINY